MKRRLAVAVILPATAGVTTAAYLSGLAWPILGAAYSLLGRRPGSPMTPETEPDPVG